MNCCLFKDQMLKLKRHITIGLFLIFSLLFALFQNFAPSQPLHEISYPLGTGIPLSEIVQATRPQDGLKSVYINADEVAFIDQSIDVDQLIINGELHCDDLNAQNDIEIKARVIYVNGIFQCGQESSRYLKNHTISLKSGNVDPRTSVAYRGLIVNNGGKLILTGDKKKANWFRLAKTALPGDNTITLDQSLQTRTNYWKVGDEIVIGPTSYNSSEAETFTILGIQHNIITLNSPLLYRHLGQREIYNTTYNGKVALDQRAEVANLKRNILIRADESSTRIADTSSAGAELGGHVMVMNGGKAYVDSIEFFRMGQAGVMARYPFHWHFVGDAPGQFIRNSSIHHSFQRCINIHRTNQVSVTNNTCYNFKGHGFFLEDGVEVDNIISGNLGIMARYPHSNKTLLASDRSWGGEGQGRFPNVSVFWISNPKNSVINNVASGSVGTGFWMSFEGEIKNSQGVLLAHPAWETTTLFESNIAHTTQVGFTWDGAAIGQLTGNPNNPKDRFLEISAYSPPVVPVFKKLLAFKNKLTGFYFRGATAVYDGCISADNGRHYWLAYNQIVKNAVIISRSSQFTEADQLQALENVRTDRIQNTGVVLYDGPFELNGVDFLNFPTQKVFHASTEITPLPFNTINGFDKLTNTSKRVSFSPEPIHRLYMPPEDQMASWELIGSNSIRDEDGTLSGSPGILVGKNSLGVLPSSNCQTQGEKFQGFKKCPIEYTESLLHFFGGEGNPNAWNMPFVTRRNDGVLSYPMNLWPNVLSSSPGRRGGMRVALANSTNVDYQILFNTIKNPSLWIMSEISNPKIPVVKVIGQGKNCFLEGKPSVGSLEALKASENSAYYSNGDDFYFRLIPKTLYWTIKPNNPYGSAVRYTDGTTLKCPDLHSPVIKGYVDSVSKPNLDAPIKIKGWACNFSKDQQIDVRLTVGRPGIFQKLSLLKTIKANLASEAAVAFECGVPNTTGFRYEFILSRSEAELHQGKKIYINGISTTNGANLPLMNSGIFTMPVFPK